MRDPFSADLNEVDDDEEFEEKLIDLRADNGATIKFSSLLLSCFWASQLQTHSTVATMALKKVLPFTTTYQCEAGFLSWVKIIWKYRNIMDVRQDIGLALLKSSLEYQSL